MPLELHPLPASEFTIYYNVAASAFRPGIMSVMYPNPPTQEDTEHAVAAMIRAEKRHPGRAQIFKVVNTDLPDEKPFHRVVGVASWKVFPHERREEDLKREEEEDEKDIAEFGRPPNMNPEGIEAFGKIYAEYRKKHLGNRPYVLLHVLATRPEFVRQGVGKKALEWGIAKSEEMGVPMWLEGSPQGVGLYKKVGFEVVDTLPWDARDYGYHEALTHLCMLRQPVEKEGL
jgi:GNAT superfamily N-acetyltransferase